MASRKGFAPTRESKTSWEQLEGQRFEDSVQYRDVYEDQQLERKRIGERQTPLTRTVAAVAFTVLVAVVVWFFVSLIEFLVYTFGGMGAQGVSQLLSITDSVNAGLPFTYFLAPSTVKVVITFVVSSVFFTAVYALLMRNLETQNALEDTSDINDYMNDQHIALPEEIMRKFDFFPDVGAHSSVLVSSMISHVAFKNKGLDKVDVVKRQAEDGDDAEFYDILDGNTSELSIARKPMVDEDFGHALFNASALPKELHKAYDTTQIPYNPEDKNREKLKGYDTVADLVNGDWELPLYEPQRPAGAYVVDTNPVNTMILAITRAGKGQTYIEPVIDMWLREKNPNNMVINDPKGELLVKNYVPATVRGFQPVQLNLINALKTDICNPLNLAIQAAREGDMTRCAQYVENMAEVFFPLDGGEDPVWPNAANNAFKRAAYGLIDFYFEEEREYRIKAEAEKVPEQVIETHVDEMWGKVTPYNCYQLFVQLSAKKMKKPGFTEMQAEFKKLEAVPKEERGQEWKYDYEKLSERFEAAQDLWEVWEDQNELDMLSVYFAATERLPRNSVRTLVNNANNALKSMGAAEKMLASVYGIAVTAMSYFADPTISTLTSGTPSQNVDLAGFSFPRRFGVRLHADYARRYHLVGLQARWQGYADAKFEKSLGKEFYHEDMINREGWAKCYLKGIFPEMTGYLKLEIVNPQSGVLVKTFYFRFEKDFQKSLDGRYYMTDPVLESKIVKNGVLVELRPKKSKSKGTIRYFEEKSHFDHVELDYHAGETEKVTRRIPVIVSSLVRYSEKPKMLFMVTPPHLMKYAKMVLIILKQLVDLNFDQSYMTKSNQKPLYKTRFMLDELGNLQSEGHGISGFETMLSIGLGQEQQFTLILQTLQQLRDVYGESVDKIVQGNAQPMDSLIATAKGWKRMGDMAVGDEVITPKGGKAQVIGVYPRGVRKVYKVTRRDGSVCYCCNEHLWKVKVEN